MASDTDCSVGVDGISQEAQRTDAGGQSLRASWLLELQEDMTQHPPPPSPCQADLKEVDTMTEVCVSIQGPEEQHIIASLEGGRQGKQLPGHSQK